MGNLRLLPNSTSCRYRQPAGAERRYFSTCFRAVLGALFLMIACGYAHASGTLSVSTTYVNFGSVTVGQQGKESVTLKNTGSSSVTISSVTSSSGSFWYSGASTPATLPAGYSVTVTMTFTPKAAGATTGTLTVNNNASNNKMTVNAAGTRVTTTSSGGISANPPPAEFWGLAVGVTDSETIQLKNTGSSNISLAAAAISGTGFSVTTSSLPTTLAAGKTATVSIAYKPSAAASNTGSLAVSYSGGAKGTVTVP